MRKSRANKKVAYAIKTGKLKRQESCEICGFTLKHEEVRKRVTVANSRLHFEALDKLTKKIVARYMKAHHDNYDEPFKIRWLCASCHKKLHLGLLSSVVYSLV